VLAGKQYKRAVEQRSSALTMLSPVTAFDSRVCVAKPMMMELAPPASSEIYYYLLPVSSTHTPIPQHLMLELPLRANKSMCPSNIKDGNYAPLLHKTYGMASKQQPHACTR
jgi:hypothetical protein